MAKRPRLSTHLRLAGQETPSGASRAGAEGAGAGDTGTVPKPASPERPPEALVSILADAGAEMTRLGWLGWSQGWETYMRLSRYWLGTGRWP